MKKIFSLALMATALLISGQVKAAPQAITTFGELQAAFANGGDYYLANSEIVITSTLQLYSKFAEAGKVVNLNFNGQTLTADAATGTAIDIFKGTLNLTNTVNGEQSTAGGLLINSTTRDGIVVSGVYEDKADWSNLNIGRGVSITSQLNAITICEFKKIEYLKYVNGDYAEKVFDGTDGPSYREKAEVGAYSFPKDDDGSDVSTGTKYTTWTPVSGTNSSHSTVPADIDFSSQVPYYSVVKSVPTAQAGMRYYAEYVGLKSKANGVNINIDGKVYGRKYGIKVNGTLGTPSMYQPNIIVNTNAEVCCSPDYDSSLGKKQSVAVYCSGQANWLIKGYVHGDVGMAILSGQVNIDDATIVGTGTSAEHSEVVFEKGSGVEGGSGCGIIVDSRANYGGNQDVTITGDTKVSSTTNIALVEKVTTALDTKVSAIVIEGGSFSGNATKGTMQFSSESTEEDKITIKSGEVAGSVKIEGETSKTTEQVLQELMPNGTYSQVIEGKQVITTGGKPQDCADINLAEPNSNVNLTGTAQTLNADKVLATVEMSNATVLTLANNVKLTVSKLVFSNADAQIIVPYNSALIVTGNEGVYTLNEDNIVLQAKADTLATFIFSANVVTNKQPMATVEYNATAKEYGAGEYDYDWNRLSVPFEVVYDRETVNKDKIEKFGGKSWTTYYRVWKNNAWTVTSIMDATSYQGLAMTNVSVNGDAKYKFKGLLQGAKQGVLNIKKGWNYFGNSYTAKMDIKELLKQMPASIKTIKIFNAASQSYVDVSVPLITKGLSNVKDVPAMQTFIFYSEEEATIDLNYEKLVWDYNK